MTMPSDEQIQEMFDNAVIDHHMECIGLSSDVVRKWLAPILSAAVEAERQRWAAICDALGDDFMVKEIKRRGLE